MSVDEHGAPRYRSPFSQHADRNGQTFVVVRKISEPDEEHDAESLPMYRIRFNDGFEIDAFQNEFAATQEAKGCPDGGTCHHTCERVCFRVDGCGPLSGVYPDDQWPDDVKRQHGAPVEAEDETDDESKPVRDLFRISSALYNSGADALRVMDDLMGPRTAFENVPREKLRRALAEAEGVLTTVDVEGFFDALFDDITRLKAAERDLSSLISGSDRTRDTELALVKRERDRADAAEKKLRTLVEAVERTVPWSTNAALAAALKAAR